MLCVRCYKEYSSNLKACPYCNMIQNSQMLAIKVQIQDMVDSPDANIIISNDPCPYDVSELVKLKREGRYLEASLGYSSLYHKSGILYTDMADWWHKTIACSGAVSSAIILLSLSVPKADQLASPYASQNRIHLLSILMCLEECCNMSIENYLRVLSGNPHYEIDKNHIDEFCGTGQYIDFLASQKIKNPTLYAQIEQMLEE